MKSTAAILATACATAVLTPFAAAQPGTRNAIVYGARAVGESQWHVGNFSLQSPDTSPLTFEVGVFFFRAQGVAMSTCVYKSYIDGVVNDNVTDTCTIIEDVVNGVPTSGIDGRQWRFNSGAQTQRVFTNRPATIPGFGYRISSTTDTADTSAAGGIRVAQAGGQHMDGRDGFDIGPLYRFNLTFSNLSAGGSTRNFLVKTPLSRVNSFTTYNSWDSNTTTEFKTSVVVDVITLHASWVPAPSPLALAVASAMFAARRRR